MGSVREFCSRVERDTNSGTDPEFHCGWIFARVEQDPSLLAKAHQAYSKRD